MPDYKKIDAQVIPLSLLLEADPSEKCIRSYLPGSLCFGAFEQGKLLEACVTNAKQAGISEIYNIAVVPAYQAQGIGSGLLRFVLQELSVRGFRKVVLGTGTFGYQLKLYQHLGFRVDGVIKDFFIDNYDEPIFERGRQHIDMARLSLTLNEARDSN
ncbi:TPA: GNAT family N-acetyltransferase [Vibrio diabolicus]